MTEKEGREKERYRERERERELISFTGDEKRKREKGERYTELEI